MSYTQNSLLLASLLSSTLLITACSSEDQEAAKEKMNAAKESVTEAASTAVEETKEAASSAVEATKDVASNVADATKEAASTAVEETKEMASAVTDTAKEAATDTTEAVAAAIAPAADAKGKEVYDSVCFACHNIGLAGAPKLGEAAQWEARIAQGNDVLYDHAINGYVGPSGSMMPAKGGRADLSDDDTKAAVDYMVSQAK